MKHSATDFNDASLLGELVDDVFQRMEQGEKIDFDELVAQYPDYRKRLEKVLPILTDLHGLDAAVGGPLSVDDDLAGAEQKCLGDFRLLRQFGCGGMGVVYEAQQLTINR